MSIELITTRVEFDHGPYTYQANRPGVYSPWTLLRWKTDAPRIPPLTEILYNDGWHGVLELCDDGTRRAFPHTDGIVEFIDPLRTTK